MVASPLNAIGILREAINIPGRNGKLMLQLMLAILSPFTLTVLLHHLLAVPVIHKVEESYEHSSVDQKDVRSLIGLELVFFAIFCILSFFGMILTIYASASTYLGKNLGLTDLIFSIRFAWKKPLATWLYVFCLTLIYAIVVMVLIKSLNLLFATNANLMVLIGSFVGIPAVFLYLYLAASWTLALVVSVLEDDEFSYGTKGLKTSEKLIKGRKLQAFFLTCSLAVLSIPIYVLFYVTVTDDDDEVGLFAQIGFGFVATLLLCIAKFFTFVVFTVLYCECKQSQGERADIELGIGYGLVPSVLSCKIQVGS